MDNITFVEVLQRAIAGSNSDLERILELYDPLIRKFAGHQDKELHQYLLLHIALNIHKFTI